MEETFPAALPFPPGVLHFPEGLPGFENLTDFTLLQEEQLLPIVFLVSVSEPRISFPAVPVQQLRPHYELQLGEEDRLLLGLDEAEAAAGNLLCLAILNLGEGTQPATANLFAPLVVNPKNWTAKQVIQFDSSHSTAAEV